MCNKIFSILSKLTPRSVTFTILLNLLPLACTQVESVEETQADEKTEEEAEIGPVSVTKSGETNGGIQGAGASGSGVSVAAKPTKVPTKRSDEDVGTEDGSNDSGGQVISDTPGNDEQNLVPQPASEWRSALLSIPRIGAGAAFSGHKVHVLGGSANRDNVDVYDTRTKTWSVEARYNEGVWISSATVAGKAVYAGGDLGSGPSNRMLIYDGSNDTWSETIQPLGYFRSIASVGEKVFMAGGMPVSGALFWTTLGSGSWSYKSSVARFHLSIAAAGGKVMFAGGILPNGSSCTNLIDIYDVATDSWSTANLSSAKGFVGGVAARNLIFFAGGGCVGGESYNDVVDIYNTDTDSWSRARLSEARYGVGAGVVGNKVVFAGGWGTEKGLSDTVDIYDLDSGNWSTARLSVPRAHPTVASTGEELLFIGGEGLNGSSSAVDIYSPR